MLAALRKLIHMASTTCRPQILNRSPTYCPLAHSSLPLMSANLPSIPFPCLPTYLRRPFVPIHNNLGMKVSPSTLACGFQTLACSLQTLWCRVLSLTIASNSYRRPCSDDPQLVPCSNDLVLMTLNLLSVTLLSNYAKC